MLAQTVFSKTDVGVEEITVAHGELTPKQRRVLIMIDGHRSVGDLAPMLKDGEIDGIISLLLERGLISVLGTVVGSKDMRGATKLVSANDSLMRVTGVQPIVTVNEAAAIAPIRIAAVKVLQQFLGPTSDDMCIRIELCKTLNELHEVINRVADVLASTGGRKAQEAFREQVLSKFV